MIIAILDTGVDVTHEDLTDNLWINSAEDINNNGLADLFPVAQGGDFDNLDNDGNGFVDDVAGYSTSEGSGDVQEDNSLLHGTSVAGIAAARTDNGIGVSGVAGGWDSANVSGAKVMALRMITGDLESQEDAAVDAFCYAIENEADVINCSWGFAGADSTDYPELDDVIDDAVDEEIVVVCSSQSDPSGLDYPAMDYGTIAVGGVNSDENLAGLSGVGDWMDLVAPNENPSTKKVIGNASKYSTFGGGSTTSAAAPMVSGTAALLKAIDGSLTWSEVREILRNTAKSWPGMSDPDFDQAYGHGMLDILAAVAAAKYDAEVADSTYSTSVTLPAGDFPNLYVPGDVLIEPGVTLTIEDDNTKIYSSAGEDRRNLGNDPDKVEWLVEGTLDVDGGSEAEIEFSSGVDGVAEGDWEGIEVKAGGSATINYALVKHAEVGVTYASDETGNISNSTFSNNTTYDIQAGSGNGGNDLTISGNTITVGGGTGIQLYSGVDGITLDDNVITGSSSTSNGITFGLGSGGYTATVTNNTISDISAGAGIRSISDASFTGNVITDCKWGIYITAGAPLIGTSSSSSDNIIDENTTGILVSGSTADPIIRNNKIRSNTFGVQVKSSADPDIGQSTSDRGNNTMTSNSTYCIWNRNSTGTISAQYNYYGTCIGGTPPLCANGSVDVTNGLCSAPASRQFDIQLEPQEPSGFSVQGASPNPLTPGSGGLLYFSLEQGNANLELQIFDISGRLVRDLGQFTVVAGDHHIHWDGMDDSGRSVTTGIYFVRVTDHQSISDSAKILVSR
ncbi:MAG: S8 family serine peptidase [Candidatus Eisenbacteria bacterium]|uniref:S8 family serine peptidase n=1 Tax=Eiseniibacteriota bacterium TaxID=2212470 RepID=A0A7Y2H3X7_UNCEI|nr:S8 family serine peptidase [Candidatus Eisenbacteria bacterium]